MTQFLIGLSVGIGAAVGAMTVTFIHQWAPGLLASCLPKWLRDRVGQDF